jgi:metal-responsive CopG/Arc/MetJ family transcriptional regulator
MRKRATMKGEKKGRRMKAQSTSAVRASISFPPDLYDSLEQLAKRKKVSLAWVVRDAAERYVADETKEGGRGSLIDGTAQGSVRRTS